MQNSLPRWDTHAHVFDGAAMPGSHYAPPECTLAMWQAAATPCGVERGVLVQPSVYGTDNSVMLDALRNSGYVHRGVVVLDVNVTDRELEAMHVAGVRGVRFNLVSPVGNDREDIDNIVAHVRPLGWHLQFFLRPADYAWVRSRQRSWGVDIVLDHLAGFHDGMEPTVLADLHSLADAGGWVKVSGFYRLGMKVPFSAADAVIRKLHDRFATRMIWGSDWPHTWYMESARGVVPSYEELLAPLNCTFADAAFAQSVLCDAPALLYR